MTTIPIVFATDENLIIQTGVCIYSLLSSCGQETQYDIYIITDYGKKMEALKGWVQLKNNPHCLDIHFIESNNEISDAYEVRGITKATYYRLLIPKQIPIYDKIIYSDVDIIFKCSLNEIYEDVDLSNYYIAGVRAYIENEKSNNYGIELGCTDSDYINAGFLILNCKKIREDKIDLEWIKLGKRNFLYQDQDIINLSCDTKKYLLPVKYNFTKQHYQAFATHAVNSFNHVDEREMEEAMRHGVTHYTGPVKPWNGLCYRHEDWWYMYQESPLFDIDYYHNRVHSFVSMKHLSLKGRIKLLIKYFFDI